MNNKLMLNGLLTEQLSRFTAAEKWAMVRELNKTYSLKEIAQKTGYSYATIHSWKHGKFATKYSQKRLSLRQLHIEFEKMQPLIVTGKPVF